ESAQQVRARVLPARLQQLPEVLADLDDGALSGQEQVQRWLVSTLKAQKLVCPAVKKVLVTFRYAHQLAQDRHRQSTGEVVDHFHPALGGALVEQRPGDLCDIWPDAFDPAR